MEKVKITLLALFLSCGTLLQPAMADVKIDGTSFPDANFRAVVQNKLDTNGDGMLSSKEIAAAVKLDCSKCGIASLKGVEYLQALQVLNCSGNSITALSLSHNKRLKYICAADNSRKINAYYGKDDSGEYVYYVPVKSHDGMTGLSDMPGFSFANVVDGSWCGARIGEVDGAEVLIFDATADNVSYSYNCTIPDVDVPLLNDTDIPDENVPKVNDTDIPDPDVPHIYSRTETDIIDTGTSMLTGTDIIDTGTSVLTGIINIEDPDIPWIINDNIAEPTVPLIIKFCLKFNKPVTAKKTMAAKDISTKLSDSLASSISIYASARCINVVGNYSEVIVVDMSGHTVFCGNSSQIEVPSGLYIVKVGDTFKKLYVN